MAEQETRPRCCCGPHAIAFGSVPDPGCPFHGDTLRCEHGGCDNEGWLVLHFGPNMTGPRRVACTVHQKVTDLSAFRDDLRSTPVEEKGEPTVCIAHGRFIPCRKDGDHRYTSNPYWVKSVRDHQGSPIDDLTWEPAWESGGAS